MLNDNTIPVDWLVGTGEMGKLVQSMDWSKTSLGPIEFWPQSIRTIVSLCLSSNFPISLVLGPKHVQIYNDGYWPLCGAKHPESMGQDFRESWVLAWPVIGEAFENALNGKTSFLEDQQMFLDRNGYLEETFFTFSFSPIRDECSAVCGLFHPVTETTAKMVGERHTRALRDLAANTGKAETINHALTLAAQTLSEFELDIPFALFYLLENEGKVAQLIASTGSLPEVISIPTLSIEPLSVPMWPLSEVVRLNQAFQVNHLDVLFGSIKCGPYPEAPTTAMALPISLPGHNKPMAILVAGVSSRLPLNESYRAFYDLLTSTVTAAVTNANAREEEHQRAETLAEIDRAKTAFFSNVSHEFRTPLTLMLSPLEDELAECSSPLPPDRRERLKTAHHNTLSLLKLVNTLLDFSRIDADRIQASYEPTDLAAYTVELASNFRSAMEKGGLTLTVECPPLPELIYIDRDIWEKIVLNLLSNAFKHTFSGGIQVILKWDEENAVLVIEDSGIGIPQTELPFLFDRFHRVKGAKSRTHEGAGIGLTLVHELVRLHGGTVQVESQEGKGSKFTVTLKAGCVHLPDDRLAGECSQLSTAVQATAYVEEALRWSSNTPEFSSPLSLTDKTSNDSLSPQLRDAPGSFRPRVLWADSNADMRDYVRRLLSEKYDVTAVSDGMAALHSALATPPDLILSDVMMPGLDGFALLSKLRGDIRTRTIPVILLSARAGEKSSVEGLEAGADDYLSKPFSSRELLTRVQTNLELSKLRREHASTEELKLVDDLSRRADADLNKSEERFLLLANSISQLAWMARADGFITWYNQSWYEYTGTTPEQMEGWGWQSVHDPQVLPTVLVRWTDAIKKGLPFEMEFPLKDAEGKFHKYLTRARPVKDTNGQVMQWFGTNTNIDDLKQAEEKIRAANEELEQRVSERTAELNDKNLELIAASRAKNIFLANMSHELRTPLNGIIGFSEILADGLSGPVNSEQKEYLGEILSCGQHLLQLINDVLDMAKVESGKMQLHLEKFSLPETVEQVLSVAHSLIQKKKIQLATTIDPRLVQVILDQQKLKQVLYNLLSNAIKFTEDGGHVKITLAPQGPGHFTLAVSDTGIGIRPENISRLFREFEQLEEGATRHYQGTGLGLALTHKIVAMQGGKIEVVSEFGTGSTFTITLPLNLEEHLS